MNDARLLTIPEVVDLLKVSRWTVYRLMQERELVGVKVRGGRRITEASVAAYVAGLIAEAA
jgi:excisionase family DNA binding protein